MLGLFVVSLQAQHAKGQFLTITLITWGQTSKCFLIMTGWWIAHEPSCRLGKHCQNHHGFDYMQVLHVMHSFMPTQHCTTTSPKTSYCSNYMWGLSFKVTKGCCWYNTTNKHLHLKKPFAQNLCENNLMFHSERSD
jgi:hypothetical protein